MRKGFKELLDERLVIFDSAMGTELYRRHQFVNVCFDELSLSKPELVKEIHLANKSAGADVLTTNSFGANRVKLIPHLLGDKAVAINRSAAEVAREVAEDELFVAGSVGPLGKEVGSSELSEDEAFEAFAEQIKGLKDGGADFIIFETFGRRRELLIAIQAAVSCKMDYIPSIALSESGLTIAREKAEEFFDTLPKDIPPPLVWGFNCGVGPKQLLEELEKIFHKCPYPVLVQPNAGYPQRISDRWIYMTSPEYFATYAKHFVQLGVRALGGCCGTSPEHIGALANSVKSVHKKHVVISDELKRGAELLEPFPLEERSRFAKKLAAGEWVSSVEIVPPLGWDLKKTIERAARCFSAGVDAINIPDGPRASSRLSPMVTAIKIQEEGGIEAILHLTCRDKNIIGMQSDLLGAAAAGINNILVITGDPPKVGDYPFATAVFDIDSIGLTRIAWRLNRGVDIGGQPVKPPTRFLIGVGVDPTSLDEEREIARFERKIEAGAEFAITQPIYDVEKFIGFLNKIKHTRIPIIAGIWPLASLKNAEFLNNEVPGVRIPKNIMERMAKTTTKEEALAEGVAIAREIITAVKPYVCGVQVSAPFGNIAVSLDVLK
ncbi:MAG: bifunctional homocysteine S-methyltransferase/methylenetetrahydrofolate reductase [Myxococcota bacterium]